MNDQARELMAKVESGVRIESVQEMTDEYRENLIHLLTMQADSELAGGYGYVPWIAKAPTVEEKHVVAQIVKDELRHAAVMYGLLADLGFDVASHVRRHDAVFTMRISSDADIGTARIPSDPRRRAGDLQQVVRPDDEHLRAPGLAQEPALPEVPAQAPRQRRGPPGVRP